VELVLREISIVVLEVGLKPEGVHLTVLLSRLQHLLLLDRLRLLGVQVEVVGLGGLLLNCTRFSFVDLRVSDLLVFEGELGVHLS